MRKQNWYLIAALVLIALSVFGFSLQLIAFRRPNDTFFYLLQDLAFLPVQVLLVTLVVNRWFQIRERDELLHKMNIVVGVFFTEVGNTLLRYFSEFDENLDAMRRIADVRADWTNRDFALMAKRLDEHVYTIDCRCADLNDLKRLLKQNREFLITLLANPNLLENAAFTQVLWAVAHLAQELDVRPTLDNLPDADYAHLAVDMRRAYVQMVREWVAYVRRLKVDQPFMFSLIARMDPFDPSPSPIIQDDTQDTGPQTTDHRLQP